MSVLAIDTLKLARKLEAGGFTPQQAAAAAEALAESLADATADLATKADIADVRRDLRETELRLEARITTTVADAKAEILKWMFGAMAAQTGLIVALIKLLPAAG